MPAIGFSHRDAVMLIQKFGLAPLRAILPAEEFATIARQTDCAPKRQRPLIPEVVSWLMMLVSLKATSMTQGLLQAWGCVRSVWPRLEAGCVTEEAFAMARRQLPLRFWRALFQRLRQRYEQRFAEAMRWKDRWRVLAVDGSDVRLPNRAILADFFGRAQSGHGQSRQPQGRLVALCSVFTGFCLAFVFMPRRFTEHLALRHLLRHLRPHDLLLADCGFFSYAAIWHLPQRGADFLLRLSQQAAGFARCLHRLQPNDAIVQFCPTAAIRRKWPALPDHLVGRLIRYQRPGFRVSWLLTSITDPQQASADELIDLYHRRWQIETLYREWKHSLDIQRLCSHTPAGLTKEIHAHLLLINLIRWLMTEAVQGTEHHPVDLSFHTTLSLVQNALLLMRQTRPEHLIALHQRLLAEIRAARIRKRPDRSYPRPGDQKIKNRGAGKRQLPARLLT